MPRVTLANESALGVYSFTWTIDGQKAAIQWGDGMRVPMAFFGRAGMRDVAGPERFGWTGPPPPAKAKAVVRAFAQAFADALAAELDEDEAGGDER
jgi:hypothetical protein